MKRIEQFRKMNTRELANEFFYFDYEDFIKDGDNYESVIKKIMRWLNRDISERNER